ncbi:MAG: hypothetical protein GXY87_06870 [Tissierellia bacterium]|nr:hypothetical protein [Tissierellia bacterium]
MNNLNYLSIKEQLLETNWDLDAKKLYIYLKEENLLDDIFSITEKKELKEKLQLLLISGDEEIKSLYN